MRHDTLSLLDTLGGAGGPAGAGRITDADLVKWANDKARAAGRPGPPISGLQVQARSPARPRAREAGMVTRQLSVWLPTLFTLFKRFRPARPRTSQVSMWLSRLLKRLQPV